MKQKIFNYLILLIGIPILIAIGILLFNDEKYNMISILTALLSCVPFFLKFERKNVSISKLVLIAVMVALSVGGRFAFAAVPQFKPVTAIVVMTAVYFGAEAGFLTGSLTALISNMFYGQGPWTPFQMFAWGVVGFTAGILANKKWFKNNVIAVCIYGAAAGVLFSLLMDIWTVISMNGAFNVGGYIAAIGLSLPYTVMYAVSNVIFLAVLNPLLGKTLERIRIKYEIE